MAGLFHPELLRERARLYRNGADREGDPDRAELFHELADAFEIEAALHEHVRVPPASRH